MPKYMSFYCYYVHLTGYDKICVKLIVANSSMFKFSLHCM